MANNNQRAIYGILMLIFIFFVMIMIFASFTMNAFKEEGESFSSKKKGKAQIAVVSIVGPIMTSKSTIELLKKAEEDKHVKAIIIRVDSPGGGVGPSQEIYHEIRRIDGAYTESKGEEGKPIYASFGSVAASGGYYIGAAARRIYSNPGTVTGSIGVIMQFMDLHKLFEFAKVSPNVIKSGKYKDVGQPNRAMTEEEKDLLRGTLADVHEQFREDILKLRKEKIKGNLVDLSQGQIFSGRQALEVGLVDKLMGLEQAGRDIHKELKLEGDYALKYIKKKKKTNWSDLLEEIDSIFGKLNNVIDLSSRTQILAQ